MANNMTRLKLYLNDSGIAPYCNTEKETELLNMFVDLFVDAQSEHDGREECSAENLDKWRRAYLGTLNALTKDGTESKRKSRQLRKMAYEIVESTVDNSVPMPKIQPRYKRDLPLVGITENYLKFKVDRILTKYENDRSERATYVDGTGWYKIWWDSLDRTHDRSGDAKIKFCTCDQVYPQPGVTDYKQLEYIFEKERVSTAKLYDLYGRVITPDNGSDNMVNIISCYYLNDDHVVGLFMWSEASRQVICNESDWQIRKLRKCKMCGAINPQNEQCSVCGSKQFKFENATTEVLSETLYEVYNPYKAGDSDDPNTDIDQPRVFLSEGSEIPFYRLTQLPFVPRPAVSIVNSIYGLSTVKIILDMQDAINKVLTKAVDKTLKSGAVVTKPEKMKIADTDETFKIFGVRSAEEAAMVQAKQIVADTSQDITIAALLYDSGKSSSGITNSFQGARDTTAVSGKAKEYSALQAAGRIESLRVMKSAAFAGVYELLLKYLLAFSDESRAFVKVLPDGTQVEEVWSKYLFLDRDKYGNVYYRDDFTFDCDPSSTLSQNRMQMWQETQNKFIQGAFGNPADPRTLTLFWNIMRSLQYPLAETVIAGIKENEQHLPMEVEQAILNNPELLQLIEQMMSQGDGRGGARANSGPDGNGATHAANVERTNERNRSQNVNTAFTPQSGSVTTRGESAS